MRALVLDLETTIKQSARRIANPFDPDNFIVCVAYKYLDNPEVTVKPFNDINFLELSVTADILIGQNIKFDLLYLLNAIPSMLWLKRLNLYDTMLAEYLITGQQSKFCSLNKLSAKYGGTLKESKIAEYWAAGVNTPDIPQDMLYEYAKYDILNTELVYKAQQKSIKSLRLENLINVNMDDLLATTIIEYNGMMIDSQFANQKIKELGEANYEKLNSFLPKDLPFVFNWNSTDHLSALLFGGEIKYTTKEEIGFFKTGSRAGQIKTKIVDHLYTFPPRISLSSMQATKKRGVFKVDDSMLSTLADTKGLVAQIANAVLEERTRSKQINTYYRPMADLSKITGKLHAELIHVQTNTGRLSSRNPNIQNFSKGASSDIKACVISRHFNEGSIVEIDASQLEIVVQAYLSQDTRMINEIRNGTDFHCLRLASKTGKTYEEVYKLCKVDKDPAWDYQRTVTKTFSFQRAYGAGSKAIAASTGLSESEVKDLIESENKLFPQVQQFNDDNIAEVQRNKKLIKVDDKIVGMSHMTSITGRQYVFYEEDAPDFLRKRGIDKSFSPTQIKNYVVQGFGAEILAVFRADLARKLIGRENRVCLINTVHDSIIFDCHNSVVDKFVEWLHKESQNVVKLVESRYNIKINVPLEFDIKVGSNWKNIK